MIRFHCPKCESQMEVDESFAGRPARCPTCSHEMRVPKVGQASGPAASAATPHRPGAATVKVDGQQVEVVPPLDTMVVVSLAFVGLSVAVFLVVGLGRFVAPEWAIASALGGMLALLGALVALPAYHNVRRSRGRRRGRTAALVAMAAGGGLFLVFAVVAIWGLARMAVRPPCEENLKRIYAALRAHADAHDGALPKDLDALVKSGSLVPECITCPAYVMRVGVQSYVLTSDVNIRHPEFARVPDLMIVSDGPPYEAHADGVRVLLLGGDVKRIPLDQWGVYKKAQGERWNEILNRIRNPRAVQPKKADEPAPSPTGPATLPPLGPGGPAALPPAAPAPAAEGRR